MYHVLLTNGDFMKVDNPSQMPSVQQIEAIEEPVVLAHVVTPTDYLGNIMKLCQDRRGAFVDMVHLEEKRVRVAYRLPLGEIVDALSAIVHRDKAYAHGSSLCEKLKELIPRQMFQVAIQASIQGKVIARETIGAMRKNVIAKCYGGDISRKRKLLDKQKEGKRRMKQIGTVEVPQEAFLAVLKVEH